MKGVCKDSFAGEMSISEADKYFSERGCIKFADDTVQTRDGGEMYLFRHYFSAINLEIGYFCYPTKTVHDFTFSEYGPRQWGKEMFSRLCLVTLVV
jgi:hypothetical protein